MSTAPRMKPTLLLEKGFPFSGSCLQEPLQGFLEGGRRRVKMGQERGVGRPGVRLLEAGGGASNLSESLVSHLPSALLALPSAPPLDGGHGNLLLGGR